MSSPRVQKMFEAMPNQLRRLGKYDIDFREVMRWQGRVGAATDGVEGYDAAVIDLTDLAWATLNKRVIIVAEPASDKNKTEAIKTQSHALGFSIDGSVRFLVYMEGPAAPGGAGAADLEYFRFVDQVQQHLVGQLAAPTKFFFTAAGSEPTLDGVDGKTASATYTETEFLLPYGMVYPGGV